jgi:hypothetical protein
MPRLYKLMNKRYFRGQVLSFSRADSRYSLYLYVLKERT